MSRKRKVKVFDETYLDKHTAEKAGDFLFDLGVPPKEGTKDREKWESARLSMRTRVKGPKTMAALAYYDVLHQGFRCKAAAYVGDTLKRLLIADKGEGRTEATTVLKGELPEEIEIPIGSDRR